MLGNTVPVGATRPMVLEPADMAALATKLVTVYVATAPVELGVTVTVTGEAPAGPNGIGGDGRLPHCQSLSTL